MLASGVKGSLGSRLGNVRGIGANFCEALKRFLGILRAKSVKSLSVGHHPCL